MELNSSFDNRLPIRSESFIQLVAIALREHLIRVPAMVRNFMMFALTNYILKISRTHRRGLITGNNVRIQRLRSISAIGSHSKITLGDHSIIYENARLEAVGGGEIHIGECSILGDCRISSRNQIKIGKRFLTSWNVFIQDYDSHPVDPNIRAEQVKRMCRRFYPRFGPVKLEINDALLSTWTAASAPILIGDDVWVGANTTILKGARIGSGSTIASGSTVVAGDYPPGCVLAGSPARIVRVIKASEVST